ncbi:L-rhamnose mutarotase [Roseinatronobacter alkalisoli]|uniref:L-rhamnose mutarotase n=1 Tax=Roseinatronobacter alkalisoli TaxID=3028235 RepID=A0ABT5T7H1_9RHOB|nr:L-rhamnose mutarotase [Roseinatronobacter sp. HJB301]MDD7970894.1 L-rhamnose mutarotase [Roseinatronobacter sp. HJB301]
MMERHGSVIRVHPDHIAEYKRLHAAVWPEILAMITACNIRNYSIYLKEPENLMFAYFEYHGTDFAGDMARMAADPRTQEWWAVCMPCQVPMGARKQGEWWAEMQEVFHHD